VENALKLVVREVFELLYSPVNAFRKIIEKPDVKGVLLVLAIVIASTIAFQYVYDSKLFYETRTPSDDYWTESLTNQQYSWLSNGSLSIDNADYKLGNQDGNGSIASMATNGTSIWMTLTTTDIFDVTKETGYKELFFWIKWTQESTSFPSSASLKLFSGSQDRYFESDITSLLASSGQWTNATVSLDPAQGWASVNSSDWHSITDIEFQLDWASPSELTVKIDGLFFRDYLSPIETGRFAGSLVTIILQVAMNWILWAGILTLVAKLFQEELGTWNVVFIIIGYVFMATVVTNILSAVVVSTLPSATPMLDATARYYTLTDEAWLSSVAYQLLLPIFLIGEAWIAALSAVALRLMKETTWGKAATIAAVAFAIRFLLRLFLGF